MNRSTALALLALPLAAAAAQIPAAPPNPQAPNAATRGGCAPGFGNGATVGSGQSDLSDKLARSNGVLCPPAGVDPDMRVAPPQGGTLRILPPPGTPGGHQKAIPK